MAMLPQPIRVDGVWRQIQLRTIIASSRDFLRRILVRYELAALGPVFARNFADQHVDTIRRAGKRLSGYLSDLADEFTLLFERAAWMHFEMNCWHWKAPVSLPSRFEMAEAKELWPLASPR